MRAGRVLEVVGLMLLLGTGCGQSDEERAAEKATAESRAAAEALENATGASRGTTPEGNQVEPVQVQELQASLPQLSGWERGPLAGERILAPVPFSETTADYTRGDANISVKIVDSAFSQLLIAPWAMFLSAGYERQDTDGYERSINIGGQPGFERYHKADKRGELNLVVAKRFLVTVEGDNIADTKILHEFVSRLDTAKLDALK